MRNRLNVLITCAGLFILGSCISGCKKESAYTGRFFTIGVILPLDQDKGLLRENALRTAVDAINESGGIGDGYRIELVVKSSAGADREVIAAAAANEITNSARNVVGFITSFSACSNGVLEKVGITGHYPVISGASTSGFLTGKSPYFHRLCPPDSLEAKVLTVQAKAYGISSVAIAVEEGDLYSSELATTFQRTFGSGNAPIVKFSQGDPGYSQKINQLLTGNPEAIFISMLNPSVYKEFIDRLSQLNGNTGPKNTTFIFCDALCSTTIFESSVGMMTGEINGHPKNFGAMPAADASTGPYQFFQAELQKRYHQPVASYNAQFYDIGFLYAMAIEKTLTETGPENLPAFRERLNFWIRQVSHGNPGDPLVMPTLGWKSIKYACLNGGVDYQGASGNCNIDLKGNTITPYAIQKIIGSPGKYQFETIIIKQP